MRRRGKFPNLDKLDYLHFSKVQTRKEKKKKNETKTQNSSRFKNSSTLFLFLANNTRQDKTRQD